MKYIGTCKDRKNNSIKVEIVTNETGNDKTITIVDDGIQINYNSDSIFKSIKKSGASITIYTDTIMDEFYTGELLNPKVYIYKNNSLIWYGYVSPTIFTQPFVNNKETLTLECIDTLANLEYIDYAYVRNATSIVSFIDIIRHILDKSDPDKTIKSIYCTTSITVNGTTDILDELASIERNFSDEIDDIMKCDEVIEEIFKFLGLCMFQYKDAYYIVDYFKLNSSYKVYDREGHATNTLSATPIDISTIGVGAADANISLDGVYNKITIIANTLKSSNPIESSDDSGDENTTTNLFDDLIPNSTTTPYETKDIWVNTNVDRHDYTKFSLGSKSNFMEIYDNPAKKLNVWDTVAHDGWKHYKVLNAWYKLGEQWDCQRFIQYVFDKGNGTNRLENYDGAVNFDMMNAIWWDGSSTGSYENRWGYNRNFTAHGVTETNMDLAVQKIFVYDAETTPSEYKWETYLTVPIQRALAGFNPWFLKTEREIAPLKGGALVINFEFFLSQNNVIAAPSVIPEFDLKFNDTITDTHQYVYYRRNRNIFFPAKLSIGDKYWNGTSWQTYTEDFLRKIETGYFEYRLISQYSDEYNSLNVNSAGGANVVEHIYKIWNDYYHDWDYVTKSEYDASNERKETIDIPYTVDAVAQDHWVKGPRQLYFIYRPQGLTQVPQEYHTQYMSDRFLLAYKAPQDQLVYGSKFKLNNTASYDMNLVTSEEGIAIPIPTEETFSGTFRFSLSKPVDNSNVLVPGGGLKYSSISGMDMHISDLYIKHSPINDDVNVFEKKNTNNDITYSNDINSNYVQSYDDVQIKINTYKSTIDSFSYVFDRSNNYVEEVTYNNKTDKQEHHLIDKYVSHFSSPKFKYTGTLHDIGITPCSIIHQGQLNKDLAIYKATYNILTNTVEVESVEV